MWYGNTLILLLVAATEISPQSSSEHVPPLPLNISKNINITNDTSNSNKVPTSSAAVSAAGYMPVQQAPASAFFLNYNQQNVVQLRGNVESKLLNIRNLEMLVTKIQEIFDSIHFASSVSSRMSAGNVNESMQQDLQVFSQRLGRKLQRATHVVLELRDLLRFNLSKVLLQQHSYDDDGDDDAESEFDFEMEDTDTSNVAKSNEHMHLFLNTHIENCQLDYETSAESEDSSVSHYNKHQIQIFNYLKSDETSRATFLNENNGRSVAANSYIADQLTQIRQRLSRNQSVNEANSKNNNSNKSSNSVSHFKHIYFLSSSDGAPASAHFRQLYVSAIKRKFVLLLIDIGSALNAELFELTKNFIQEVLLLLEDTDYISLVTVSNEADFMFLDAFPTEAAYGIYGATRPHKDEILNYVNNLNLAQTLTNHTLGFEYAFQMLHRLQQSQRINSSEQPIELIYVTRGLLTNLSDAMNVLQVLAQGQSLLLSPIIINTCAVVLDEKRIMYEKQFLTDVATQNYTKFDIDVRAWLPAGQEAQLTGVFFVLNKMLAETIPRASSRIFNQLFVERYLMDTLEVHHPVVDAESGDVLVSITHAVPPYGVVGVDLYLSDLLEDLLNYPNVSPAAKQGYNYAFLLDRSNGNTLAHPAFPRPLIQRETAYPVNIAYLENATDFASVRKHLLHDERGNTKATVYVGRQQFERTYQWQSVLGIYVLCLVSSVSLNSNSAHNASAPPQRYNLKDSAANFDSGFYGGSIDLLYHRLDLMQNGGSVPHSTCRYFRQLATMDAPTLFLSASAFESPFEFLHNNRPQSQLRFVEIIKAYLQHKNLFQISDLRPCIRQEVGILYQAMQQLKRRHQDGRGSLRAHIIRRYIASVSGVLQIYPGCLLSSSYDATRRPWFRQAMAHPGRIVSTAPYLDAGGAGYIVTIAHTIFEGKAHALHSAQQDRPVAVVALDVPYAFYYRLVLDSTPMCQLPHMKCLLFEHEGYLLAHPSMLQVSTPMRNQRRPHEHLTHKESYLANDMLNHGDLVRKLGCASYQNRTLQRYYAFNTSLSRILSNVVHGERTKYAIALIRGTNMFAAVLNSSCDGGAFCPCSTIDRVCLNCKRMDQTDCECPCECPMFSSVGPADSDDYANYTQHFAYCAPPSEHFLALPPATPQFASLPSCASVVGVGSCDLYATQRECLGVMGCEWCQQDVEGNSFAVPFCSSQAGCFNGVLSSQTPYGELDELEMLAAHNPQREQHAYSAFGPLGGAIVVLAMVIGFAIYCYRHNLDTQAQEQFYVDSVQEENYGLPLSRFNFDDCQAHDEPPIGGYDHAAAQRQLMHAADISPYHMSSGSSYYRRPPNGESDHGYSTMTPHEDSSDQQCFTLAEPLLLHDKRHSKSDTMSISTSISSPTNRQQAHPYLSNQPASKTERYKQAQQQQITSSPCRGATSSSVYGQTTLPIDAEEPRSHYILAPVTVHRHMETAES